MNHRNYKQLADQYGTPFYLFDLDALHARANAIAGSFGSEIELCFALKANPFLCGRMGPAIGFYEVCSPGELSICERAGIDMRTVVFSGVNKTMEDVARAMDDGVGFFTAESPKHIRLIDACANERGIKVPLLLRLSSNNQFGMDAATIEALCSQQKQYSGVDFYGIHYFVGTQRKKTSDHLAELDMLEQWINQLEAECGISVRHLEYGPGLGVSYFGEPDTENGMPLLRAIAPKLRELAQRRRVVVEMGRFFSAHCGSYVTAVNDIKTTAGVHYAIVDGGMHHLSYAGQMLGMHAPDITHIGAGGAGETWTVCGSLCTTNDILVRRLALDGLAEGDLLVFHGAGAYAVTEGLSLFLSRDLPAVLFCSDVDGIQLLREHTPTNTLNYGGEQL